MAEYLAHGYKLGDQVIQRGIAYDSQHGIYKGRKEQSRTEYEEKH